MVSLPPSGVRTLADVRRVLIVDDALDSAELLALVLQAAGCDTRIAHDGPSALLLSLDFLPDFAFLDIGLPGMDGFELARALRRVPQLAACRLFALTGYGPHDVADSSIFDLFLTKPVDPTVLIRLVARPPRDADESAASG